MCVLGIVEKGVLIQGIGCFAVIEYNEWPPICLAIAIIVVMQFTVCKLYAARLDAGHNEKRQDLYKDHLGPDAVGQLPGR